MMAFLQAHGTELIVKTWEQIYISAVSLALGIIVAVPLGIALTRCKKIARFVIGLASMLQTIPSLALLALMIPILGIGKTPAIVALFIYSLLPILRNTYAGMEDVDPTLASYIGAGGLGDFIFNGLDLYEPDLIIGGTIPVTILALVADWLLGIVERKLTPTTSRGGAANDQA